MIKFSEARWSRLLRDLFHRRDVETAGLVFAEQITTPAGLVLAVRDAFVVPEDAYSVRRIDQLQLHPVSLNRLVRPAKDRGLSVFTIHTHPGATEAWFSRADDAGDDRLLRSFQSQMPNNVHGSMVAVENGMVCARGLIAGGRVAVPVRVVGRTLSTISHRTRGSEDAAWFGRQVLALGAAGQAAFRGLRVGVVGAGGTGSVVIAQLAHQGIGALVLVDGDLIEKTNVPRILGATMADVGRSKVDVARRYVNNIGFGTEVQAVAEPLTVGNASQLSDCDIVFSCVDRQTPRAILNRFAYSLMIPVIDVGVGFRVDDSGTITGDAGRVVVIGPGRSCLGCWGHLDPEALRIEALAPEERAALTGEGYVQGSDEPQPSVMAFNTMVAASGVVELMRMVTGFAGSDDPPQRLAFSFSQGTVRRNSLAGNGTCVICGLSAVG